MIRPTLCPDQEFRKKHCNSILSPVVILTHSALAFFALAMTIISMWVKRSPWIWGPFLVLAFALGHIAKLVTPVALIPVVSLLVLQALLYGDIRGRTRLALVASALTISFGLITGSFPGFTQWPVLNHIATGKSTISYTLFLNFSKPFIGIAVLAADLPLIKRQSELYYILKRALPLILGAVALTATTALFLGLVHFDPKMPYTVWFFLIYNLIFVSIIDEAFWRGFVQRELFRAFGGKGALAAASCVLLTALASAILHGFLGSTLPSLALTFIAAITYGSIYQCTQSLEMSVLTHWLFNGLHFTLFTYPIAKTVL